MFGYRSWIVLGIVLLCVMGVQSGSAAEVSGAIRATGLTCEYRSAPLGIDARRPRLGWQLVETRSNMRDEVQTAYRIVASTSLAAARSGRGDLWDSGRIAGSTSLHIVYRGRPLRSGERVYWAVRVWDRAGRPSAWSAPSWWEMGLLHPADWRGAWIEAPGEEPATEAERFASRPAPLFRREFSSVRPVARARVYVTGLGYYELRINGKRVGDHVLDPGWTSYARRVPCAAYDVTSLLLSGRNALGLMLGSGWYDPLPLRMWGHLNIREHLTVGRPRALLQLVIDYADGSRQTIATDASWKAGDGPILRNSVYLGEWYDARREQDGWDRPGFDDREWRPVQIAREPLGRLTAQLAPPVRAFDAIRAVNVTQPQPGVYIYDLGENFAGWARMRAHGPAGTRITLRYGELLYPDGTLNVRTSCAGQIKSRRVEGGDGAPATAEQSDVYVLRGSREETYTPRFTFHGFRYVEVTGYPGTPAADAVVGLRLHADVASVGDFACSHPRFNRIHEMVRRTLLSNLFSVQSDCPHREKFGYGGDIVATSETAALNFDMGRFYAKAAEDLADAARPNGGLTETAPFVGIADAGYGGGSGPVGWGTAHPLLLWQLYREYGDRRLLEEQYPVAVRWLKLLETAAPDHILTVGISDHESLAPRPVALTETAFYALNARLLARIARVLGRTADESRYRALERAIREAFIRRFLQPGTGRFDMATQTCQAFALALGLCPPEERDAALSVLAEDVVQTNRGHLSTGIFGTRYLLPVLSENGHADIAYQIADQATFPGWGYMLAHGATTLWEHWDFSDDTFSHNHPMFGSIGAWLFGSVAGLTLADDAVGYDRVVVRPRPTGDLRWARASHLSPRGRIACAWRYAGERFELQVTVPVGVQATVYVPTPDVLRVTESDRPAGKARGAHAMQSIDGAAVFRVGSGTYRFAAPLTL